MSAFDPSETDFDSIYGSKYLSAGDIAAMPDGKKRVRIGRVDVAEFRQDNSTARKKFVVLFDGLDKGMVINMTNAGILRDALGRNPSRWVGADIGLYVEQVAFGNKRVPGLRLKVLSLPTGWKAEPPPAKPAPAGAGAGAGAGAPFVPGGNDFNDEIPF
jgi:hypothetical protein